MLRVRGAPRSLISDSSAALGRAAAFAVDVRRVESRVVDRRGGAAAPDGWIWILGTTGPKAGKDQASDEDLFVALVGPQGEDAHDLVQGMRRIDAWIPMPPPGFATAPIPSRRE